MPAPVQIRGLSLLEPWATLMAIGAKRIETRDWVTHYRGLLAIHASKKLTREQRSYLHEEPFATALHGIELSPACIVAVTELVDCIRIPEGMTVFDGPIEVRGVDLPPHGDEFHFGNYDGGRAAWVTRGVRRLPRPIPAVGSLGLWTIPESVRAQIDYQLAEAP